MIVYPIEESREEFESNFTYPQDAEITHYMKSDEHVTHTKIKIGNKSLNLEFGRGGYSSKAAVSFIRDYFKIR